MANKPNAWRVEYRAKPSDDWLTDGTFPAIDITEINGQTQEETFDLGECRAEQWAAGIRRNLGCEARVSFVHVPFYVSTAGNIIELKGVHDG